jgi:GTP diphosphokinase / guanosine-3',5'-bis(diphosphate) 3'-diphosphatase
MKSPTVSEIINKLSSPSKEDIKLITEAFEFARDAHAGQERYSGEPYFIHPVETAKNLAEIGVGANVIAAGLLHDTIEDGNVTEKDIEDKFGKEVLFLVQGVTKLGKLRYRGLSRHTESLRKLFVAMSQDIRVLIIKLVDRVHNMQTLNHVPKEKQQRIAAETLEIYAPLANRLGIRKLNKQLQDLSFAYLYPKEYEEVKQLLKQKKKEKEKHLEKLTQSMRKEMAKEGLRDVKIYYRIKSLYSLWKKLQRKDMDIDKVYDVAAIRIILDTVGDCYRALGIIHGVWRPLPGRIKDYIAFKKPNGYQSLHTTIFTGDGSVVEIQIRTKEMHRESEYGIASHLAYKEGKPRKAIPANLLWFRHLLPSKTSQPDGEKGSGLTYKDVPAWVKDLNEMQEEVFGEEYLENLKADFLQHRMFVFTPLGDVVDLPVGATPIDFAYNIHSDIGNHLNGAKVNGKMVSLDTELQNGDQVEILTKPSSKPSRKWMAYAKTTLAQRQIRSAIRDTEGTQRKIK